MHRTIHYLFNTALILALISPSHSVAAPPFKDCLRDSVQKLFLALNPNYSMVDKMLGDAVIGKPPSDRYLFALVEQKPDVQKTIERYLQQFESQKEKAISHLVFEGSAKWVIDQNADYFDTRIRILKSWLEKIRASKSGGGIAT